MLPIIPTSVKLLGYLQKRLAHLPDDRRKAFEKIVRIFPINSTTLGLEFGPDGELNYRRLPPTLKKKEIIETIISTPPHWMMTISPQKEIYDQILTLGTSRRDKSGIIDILPLNETDLVIQVKNSIGIQDSKRIEQVFDLYLLKQNNLARYRVHQIVIPFIEFLQNKEEFDETRRPSAKLIEKICHPDLWPRFIDEMVLFLKELDEPVQDLVDDWVTDLFGNKWDDLKGSPEESQE